MELVRLCLQVVARARPKAVPRAEEGLLVGARAVRARAHTPRRGAPELSPTETRAAGISMPIWR